MSFSFKYRPITLESGQVIKRPVIPLVLEGEKKRVKVFGYLDTGSDISIISKSIAEKIGMNCFEETEIFGITGDEMKVDLGYIKVVFGRGNEKYKFIMPTLVSRKEDCQTIIGRKGFFEQFKITFCESERRINFKKFSE